MNIKYQGKEEFLERIKRPECPSISVLSEELSIPKATLYAWKSSNQRKSSVGMAKKNKKRSPSVKFNLIAQSFNLKGDALLSFCTKNGVSIEELSIWKDLALGAIDHTESGAVISKKSHDSEVSSLKGDIARKNEALAEASAILLLQKKTSEIFRGEK
jgi:hypothetical protein